MIKKLWNSPTFMTWGNLSAKSSALVVLLPIVLSNFSQEDIVVWYLYFTIVSLQMLIDFGFLPTFSRLFSYSNSGTKIYEIKSINIKQDADGKPNKKSLYYVFLATKKIYLYMSIISFFLAITIGSFLVSDSIEKSTIPTESWLGWIFVIFIASFNLYANSYVAYLLGIDKVALVQRWQMITSLLSVISSSIIIFLTESLMYGIIGYYFWFIVNFVINYNLFNIYFIDLKLNKNIKKIFYLIKKIIWPTAWKSGLGIFMSNGIIQFSGMIVAKLETTQISASYLIALQIIRAISSFSQAPFYSRLPYFTKLFSQNDFKSLIIISKDRMKKSFFVYILMFFIVGLFANKFFEMINSNSTFVDIDLWILIGLAFLLERYGAMYLQLYTLTNHIIWHIANGITGVLMIFLVFLLHSYIGIYAFILSMLISYLLFFLPLVLYKSYKYYNLFFFKQEKDSFILCLLIFTIFSFFLIQI